MLLMLTAHSIEKAKKEYSRNSLSRHQILSESKKITEEGTEFLSFSKTILNYNLHMRECDGNAQQRAYSSPVERRSYRY